jgi:cytochrome c oxidase subunit 2
MMLNGLAMSTQPVAEPGAWDAFLNFWRDAWLRTPASTQQGRETDAMFMWLWWFCTMWFVGLMVLMIVLVIKYRRRPGQIAPRSPAHNTPLEIAWTIIPTIFLVYMFFKGFWGYIGNLVAPGHAVDMNLTAFQWGWQLNYPNGAETPTTHRLGFRDIKVFYFPAETPIRLKMQSRDVLHAFWVPDFRIKQDVVPNRLSTVWFQADAPPADARDRHPEVSADSPEGRKRPDLVALSNVPYTEHIAYCAEYCGTEHSEMLALIRIIPQDAYAKWVEAINAPTDPVELGQRTFKTMCASCHNIDGAGTGPEWRNLYGKMETLSDGSRVLVDDAYIIESIFDPARKIVKGFEKQNMTSFRGLLTPEKVQGIIAYMKTLSTHVQQEQQPAQEQR